MISPVVYDDFRDTATKKVVVESSRGEVDDEDDEANLDEPGAE